MIFKTANDVFSYMESFTNFEKAPDLTKRGYRLDRLNELCRLLGDPQKSCRAIHIAGSKGKGSTAAFTASILHQAGYKTGIYTSPHLLSYTERIAVMGEDPDETLLLKIGNQIKDVIDYLNSDKTSEELPGGNSPTTFELLTLTAFLYFKEEKCDFAVYETGLGGRLDATNVVDPELSMITSIELEHTDLLGDTLEKIAAEKGGIIKPGKPVFVSKQKPEVIRVLKEIAEERRCEYFEFSELCRVEDSNEKRQVQFSLTGQNGEEKCFNVVPGLPGMIQRGNAALALAAVTSLLPELLSEKGMEVLARGIEKASLRGRMEILRVHPFFMIDSAHTPASTEAVIDYFFSCLDEQGLDKNGTKVLIFGCVADKDAGAMIDLLAPRFDKVIVSRPGTFKKSDPEGLYQKFLERPGLIAGEDVVLLTEGPEALDEALRFCGEDGAVLVTGSFFLAAEICRAWEKNLDGESLRD